MSDNHRETINQRCISFVADLVVHIHANSMSAKTIIKISLCFNQSARWMVEKHQTFVLQELGLEKIFLTFQT